MYQGDRPGLTDKINLVAQRQRRSQGQLATDVVARSSYAAKGDVVTGHGNNDPQAVSLGDEGTVLTSSPHDPGGVRWVDVPGLKSIRVGEGLDLDVTDPENPIISDFDADEIFLIAGDGISISLPGGAARLIAGRPSPCRDAVLLNGWTSADITGRPPRYWRDAHGTVHLEGEVSSLSATSDIVFQTNPWPAKLGIAGGGFECRAVEFVVPVNYQPDSGYITWGVVAVDAFDCSTYSIVRVLGDDRDGDGRIQPYTNTNHTYRLDGITFASTVPHV